MAEVAKHNTRQDAWICVEGRAYDVTKYVEYHPGGWLPISNLAGKDVTDAFANYHPASVYQKLLPSYYMGDIIDYNVSDFVQEHRALRQELLRRGQFETRPTFYVGLGLWLFTLFSSALYMTIVRTTFNEHMCGAFLLACFWQQIAFFGHDIGHNAISHRRQVDLKTGIIIGNTTGGISLAWWKRSHNVHHVVCNSIENDPGKYNQANGKHAISCMESTVVFRFFFPPSLPSILFSLPLSCIFFFFKNTQKQVHFLT